MQEFDSSSPAPLQLCLPIGICRLRDRKNALGRGGSHVIASTFARDPAHCLKFTLQIKDCGLGFHRLKPHTAPWPRFCGCSGHSSFLCLICLSGRSAGRPQQASRPRRHEVEKSTRGARRKARREKEGGGRVHGQGSARYASGQPTSNLTAVEASHFLHDS